VDLPQTATSTAPSLELDDIVAAVDRVLGQAERPVALHEPRFTPRESELVLDCVKSNWVSSAGKYVTELERMTARSIGVRHAIAIVNGTAALHAALLVEGVEPGDEVIVPAITFVATANAVSHAGAAPHLVDSTWKTLGLDPVALDAHLADVAVRQGSDLVNRRSGRRIKAVVPVHVFGHPVEMDALLAVATKYGLVVVEDATEALGSAHRNRHCGSYGHSAVISFNGNKIVTTGGGGMILTNDDAYAERVRHVTTTAKVKHAWAFNHDEVGYNYRMPNLNAALGCAQMERLATMVDGKRRLAERYLEVFRGMSGVAIFREPSGGRSNYWLNTLVLDRKWADLRDDLLSRLNASGIQARPLWTPMHGLPMYGDCEQAPLPVADDMFARCINLPSSSFLAPQVATV
jgi:perosamine synthetase